MYISLGVFWLVARLTLAYDIFRCLWAGRVNRTICSSVVALLVTSLYAIVAIGYCFRKKENGRPYGYEDTSHLIDPKAAL